MYPSRFPPLDRPRRLLKRRVFISYYHQDEIYRDLFEEQFGHLFYNHSVKFGDIDNDLSTDYIKRLIREDHISNASVVVVLVGPKTFCRKHIDWEYPRHSLKQSAIAVMQDSSVYVCLIIVTSGKVPIHPTLFLLGSRQFAHRVC